MLETPARSPTIIRGSNTPIGFDRMKFSGFISAACVLIVVIGSSTSSPAQENKPNILVIFGDDIGYWNLSTYHQGMMGYNTPNIDRLANEGADRTEAGLDP